MTPNPATEPRRFLEHLYRAAVQRALPLHNTAAFLPSPPKGRTIVLGAGKAGGSMAQAVEALWPADAPLEGLVVTRYQHIPPRPTGLKQRIEIVEFLGFVAGLATFLGDLLADLPVKGFRGGAIFEIEITEIEK